MAWRIIPIENGSITSVPGFRATGVSCGLKKNGAADLALVVSQQPCVAAIMLTTNQFKAAPVLYDRALVTANPSGIRGVVINAGVANACTGMQGERNAAEMAALAEKALGCPPGTMAVMSTGVIGQQLPMDKIAAGIQAAAAALCDGPEGGHAAARAIMTTDTRPKERALRVSLDSGASFTIAGMAKGSGMIHPNMATLLCTVTSDVRISPSLAQAALREAVDASFNMVTIDGDTSTNDTALLLCNGLAAMPDIADSAPEAYVAFRAGLMALLVDLAKEIARDGEGATRFIEITVRGARSSADAKKVAMSVAQSALVKTAIYGRDANWGRILCAVGYSGVSIDPSRVSLWLGDLHLVRNGEPHQIDEERAAAILAQPEISIVIDLGQGDSKATVWTSDLSHEYVSINAHYRT